MSIYEEILNFLSSWIWSRRWLKLLAAFPAVAVICMILWLLINSRRQDHTQQLTVKYERAGRSALQNDNHAFAKICFEHALQLNPNNDSVSLLFAEAVRKNGDFAEAMHILGRLSREASPQTAVSASFRAAEILLERAAKGLEGATELPPEARDDMLFAEQFLRRAMELEPENVGIVEQLANILVRTDRIADAINLLEPLSTNNRHLNIMMAEWAFAINEPTKGQMFAQRAGWFLDQQSQTQPKNLQLRLMHAHMLQRSGQFELAVDVLNKSIKWADEEGKSLLRKGYVAIAIREFDRLLNLEYKADTLAMQLRLIDQMLKFDPNNVAVMTRLAQLIGTYEIIDPRFETHLKQVLTTSDAAATIHLVLGTYYAKSDRLEEALFHLELATEDIQTSATLMNNLAWVLASTRPDELNRALSLVDSALAMRPEDSDFMSTRAEVLYRMSRWEEALKCYEQVIGRTSENSLTHQRLAEIYTKLGKPEIADSHRALAKQAKVKEEAAEKLQRPAANPS